MYRVVLQRFRFCRTSVLLLRTTPPLFLSFHLVISFGPRSILLLIGTGHAVVLAVLLWRAASNRVANRLLALLLLIVAFRVVPYIIGFAGYYDAYPWLSFMPYDWSLGYGVLIWLYAQVIGRGELPARWRWHLVPALLQGAYYCVMFVQPLAFKNHWNATVHEPLIMPIETAWSLIAMCVYLVMAGREYVRYQQWLDADFSNREEFRLTWLRAFLLAFAVTLVLWSGTVLFELFVKNLNYFDRFPLYLWFSLLIYGLGIGGLRSANLIYPRPELLGLIDVAVPFVVESGEAGESERADSPSRSVDWRAMGEEWSRTIRERGWWRDPNLTAPALARELATNTTYLSRALNDGLGQNFNEFVNRLRVEAVKVDLAQSDDTRDVLTIALEAGFNSKASFNRVFKRFTGETPTEFRRRQGGGTSQNQ